MRSLKLIVPFFALIFLCSCAFSPQSAAEKIQNTLSETEEFTLTANIKADHGQRISEFKIECRYDGDAELEIIKPEIIRGVTAKYDGEKYELSYGGNAVTTGAVTRNGLSPAEAIPVLINQWKTGYITASSYEKINGIDAVYFRSDITDSIFQGTWFEKDSARPVHSEIYEDRNLVIICDFEDTEQKEE